MDMEERLMFRRGVEALERAAKGVEALLEHLAHPPGAVDPDPSPKPKKGGA